MFEMVHEVKGMACATTCTGALGYLYWALRHVTVTVGAGQVQLQQPSDCAEMFVQSPTTLLLDETTVMSDDPRLNADRELLARLNALKTSTVSFNDTK